MNKLLQLSIVLITYLLFVSPVLAVTQPTIQIEPDVVQRGSNTEVRVTINLGPDKASQYNIFTGQTDITLYDSDTKGPALIIPCSVELGGCQISPFGWLTQEYKPAISADGNTLTFSIPADWISGAAVGNQVIAIKSGRDGREFTRVSQSFTVQQAPTSPADNLAPTVNPSTVDTKDTGGLELTVALTNPADGEYRVLFTTGTIETTPRIISISCDTTNLGTCLTKFKLPAIGLTPGPYTIEVQESNSTYKTRGNALLTVTGDPTKRPGLKATCQTNPNDPMCTSSAGQLCDITTGSIFEVGDPRSQTAGGILTAIGCVPKEPRLLVEGLLRVSTAAGGGIALLFMILGAFKVMTSAGNQQNLQAGREQFQNAVIGLLFIIFSVLLLKIIGVDILQLGGFS